MRTADTCPEDRPVRALGRSRSVLVVLMSLVALGVAGCGSDDGAEPGADGTTQGVAPTEPAADEVPEDLCTLISAAELSDALGVAVTTEVGPSGDCEFGEEDPRGLSGNVGAVGFADTNGGFDGYVSGLDASIRDATATELSGIGQDAVVKVGLPVMGSGENLMAGGVVDRGEFLLQVTLVQGRGIPAADLLGAAEKALRLLDAKTS